MVGNSLQQHRPTFRAVVANKDVSEQDDGEGLGGITQPVDSLIHKSSKNPQFIAAHKTHDGESDQAGQICKDIFDCLETFLFGILLEFRCLFGELVAQGAISQGLVAFEEGIEFQLILFLLFFFDSSTFSSFFLIESKSITSPVFFKPDSF